MPGSVKEEAVSLAIRLIIKLKELDSPQSDASVGIVQFVRTWGKEKLIKVTREAAEKAMLMKSPSLCIYDGKLNRFLSLRELRET